MPWNVCRICLAGDKKMYSVENTDIFEKVTGNVLNKDKRPSTLCYICFYQLSKCLKLRQIAKQSEDIFAQFFAGGFEFTEETVLMLNERKLHKYLVTPVQDFSVGVYDNIDSTIKKEDCNGSSVEESSMDVRNNANYPQIEHTDKNINDGILAKGIKQRDGLNHSANIKVGDHKTDNMDVIMMIDDGKISSDNENSITIRNEDKIPLNKPKTQNKEYEVNEKKDITDQTKPKRNVCFTLKFNVSNNNYTSLQKSKHKLNVTDDKVGYTCEYCEKSYEDKYSLRKHLKTHEENLYECEYCSEKFYLKRALKLHQDTHKELKSPKLRSSTDHDQSLKEKSHKCEFCKKLFSQLSHLQQHTRIHTGERPFKCETCGKGFAQSSNLKQHNRVHSGDKPYQCNSCPKAFGQLSNLEQHKRKHHAG